MSKIGPNWTNYTPRYDKNEAYPAAINILCNHQITPIRITHPCSRNPFAQSLVELTISSFTTGNKNLLQPSPNHLTMITVFFFFWISYFFHDTQKPFLHQNTSLTPHNSKTDKTNNYRCYWLKIIASPFLGATD